MQDVDAIYARIRILVIAGTRRRDTEKAEPCPSFIKERERERERERKDGRNGLRS
jgi:hypothetical protein